MASEEKLLKLLGERPRTAAELAAATGLDESSILFRLRRLVAGGRIKAIADRPQQTGRICWLYAPAEPSAAMA